MGIPKLTKENITAALDYIDEHGVPDKNLSAKYLLVLDNAKKYPPKYVIAVADHIANGGDISTDNFNTVEAKSFFEHNGFNIEIKQEKYELRITADKVVSTDERFSMDNIYLGDNYKPLKAYFERKNGEIINRNYIKGERRNSNQTLPRIAFQMFEKEIDALSADEKENFPVCQYSPNEKVYCGIFNSIEKFREYRNTIEYMTYKCKNGQEFVIYCWNVFSTILFVQECLKRFGSPDDCFVLIYREKDDKEIVQVKQQDKDQQDELKGYINQYSQKLIESKNMIFRGAPGTGKTYLARQIAADIVSNGYTDDYTMLSDEQKKQIEFVQFHPNYDYSDFVEGLRPKKDDNGSMNFELKDGVFKKFVEKARKNYEDSQKSYETIEKELTACETVENYLSNIDIENTEFKTVTGNKFYIVDIDDEHISISIPQNDKVNSLKLSIKSLNKMVEENKKFNKVKDITEFFGSSVMRQVYSYYFVLYNEIIKSKVKKSKIKIETQQLKKYIFIIDEINRGEISKIFGELFFTIDPGYRGHAGEVSTQYSNLHVDSNEKFYIPDNVYIIGTMNDIDRSVDSFDFAMRRRFRFVKIKADENLDMLEQLQDEDLKNEAIERMTALNEEISNVEELNDNYQIGASYFLKLKTLNFDQLWEDYLQPLLQDYIQGMYNEESIMSRFEKAYGYNSFIEGNNYESTEN